MEAKMGFCKQASFPVPSVYFSSGSRRRQSLFFSTRITSCRSRPPYKVFINHRGLETKRNIASLIHDRLDKLKLQSFLDYKSLKPGEKVEEAIETAIRECSIGLAILSPNYCTSEYCLSELVLMMELEKAIIPIFFGVKISDLEIVDDGRFPDEKLQRFKWALEQAKGRSGITIPSCNGDWVVLLRKVEESVVKILKKLEASKETNLSHMRFLKNIVNQMSISG